MKGEEGGCTDLYEVGWLVAVVDKSTLSLVEQTTPSGFFRGNSRMPVMCWVLGTLGRCCREASLPFTVALAATSLAFFLFNRAAEGVDDPSAGLEGFEEESRL